MPLTFEPSSAHAAAVENCVLGSQLESGWDLSRKTNRFDALQSDEWRAPGYNPSTRVGIPTRIRVRKQCLGTTWVPGYGTR
eukprot:169534-Rhodomonas_salina.2